MGMNRFLLFKSFDLMCKITFIYCVNKLLCNFLPPLIFNCTLTEGKEMYLFPFSQWFITLSFKLLFLNGFTDNMGVKFEFFRFKLYLKFVESAELFCYHYL